MEQKFVNNSVVILGNLHNPSLISDNFLLKSGILERIEDLNRQKLLITPAISQFVIKDYLYFIVESEKLKIVSTKPSKEPFEFANKYCKALPHIKTKAIGINFVFKISYHELDNWFKKHHLIRVENSKVENITYTVPIIDNITCNIKLQRENKDLANVEFNFHHHYNDEPLSDINIDFIEKYENYDAHVKDYLSKIF